MCVSTLEKNVIYLHQRKPQLRRDTQGLEVLVPDMVETVQNQGAGSKDLTGPAKAYKTKASKLVCYMCLDDLQSSKRCCTSLIGRERERNMNV